MFKPKSDKVGETQEEVITCKMQQDISIIIYKSCPRGRGLCNVTNPLRS